MVYVSTRNENTLKLDALSDMHQYTSQQSVHALEPTSALTSTLYTTFLVSAASFTVYLILARRKDEDHVVKFLWLISIDISITFLIGFLLHVTGEHLKVQNCIGSDTKRISYGLLVILDFIRPLGLYYFISEPPMPTVRNSPPTTLPHVIVCQMIWIYRGLLLLLSIARLCQVRLL
jgi:hypothetical protein